LKEYILSISFSLGIISASLTALAMPQITKKIKPKYLELEEKKVKDSLNVDPKQLFNIFGVFFIVGLIFGIKFNKAFSMGLIFGVIALVLFNILQILSKAKEREEKVKECLILFDTITTFLKTGVPMQKALEDSKPLLKRLTPAVEECIASWHLGSEKALQKLKERINLPEGDRLVALLLFLNRAGIENYSHILLSESQRLEEIRKTQQKVKITQKPVFLIIYRFLPLLVIMGLVMGVLFTRFYTQLNSLGQ